MWSANARHEGEEEGDDKLTEDLLVQSGTPDIRLRRGVVATVDFEIRVATEIGFDGSGGDWCGQTLSETACSLYRAATARQNSPCRPESFYDRITMPVQDPAVSMP